MEWAVATVAGMPGVLAGAPRAVMMAVVARETVV